MLRILSLVFSLVLAGAMASSGQQPSRFEDVTDVVVVEVPVQVIRDGEPVRGLTADNFRDSRRVARSATSSVSTSWISP